MKFFTLFGLFIFFSASAISQTNYRSAASGNWTSPASWETFDGSIWIPAVSSPTSADGTITIRNGHTISLNGPVTADEIIVDNGGIFSVNVFVSTSGGNNLTLNDGPGTDLIVNGTLNLGGFNIITGTGNFNLNNIMNWTSGTLDVVTVAASGTSVNLSGDFGKNLNADLTINGTFNWATGATAGGISFTDATFTNNGILNENFSSDRGFLNLGGTNAFINNGRFVKNTTFGFFNNTVPFTNANDGIMSGVGSYNLTGTVSNTGDLSPGVTIGILTVTPSLVSGTTPNLWFRVEDGSGAGTGNDRLDFTGAVNISGATLIVTANSAAPLQTYTLMTAPGINGFVGSFANTVLPNGYTLNIDNTVNPSLVTVTKTIVTLPVVWGGFDIVKHGNQVHLKWTTLEEINTSHFIVEHSVDGRNYNAVGTLQAAGNSASTTEYSFVHNSPNLKAHNYYRIKQVDENTKVSYSNIRIAMFNVEDSHPVQIVNPTRGMLQMLVKSEDVSIEIVDNSGRVLRRQNVEPGLVTSNIQHLPSGTYHLIIYWNKIKIESQQILKY